MKLAITADIHLRGRNETPNRWQSLKNILNQINDQGVENLIIAGDLFDAESHNYSEFDGLFTDKKYQDINIHIIPGNHDQGLNQANFTADNIKIYQQPEIIALNRLKIFFAPYQADKTMANVLSGYAQHISNPWVLIGHGNWAETIRTKNPTEPGVYMPLSKSVVNQYQPSLTVLGHIHKKMHNTEYNVFYPGSPCGLDITETGRRSFLILDLTNLEVTRREIDSGQLFFDESIVVYPMEDEEEYWQEQVKKLKDKWDLKAKDKKKTVIRIKISGFSSDKRKLKKYFKKAFKDFKGWKENKVDVSQVSSSSDNYELLKISQKVIQKIKDLDLTEKPDQPSKDEIISQAIKTIYSK